MATTPSEQPDFHESTEDALEMIVCDGGTDLFPADTRTEVEQILDLFPPDVQEDEPDRKPSSEELEAAGQMTLPGVDWSNF